MKVFTLVILLVSVYCMEGAIVKREEPAAQPEAQQELQEAVQGYFNTLTQFFTDGLAKQTKIEELKAQAEAFFQRAQAQLIPLTDQLKEKVNQLFSTLSDSVQQNSS